MAREGFLRGLLTRVVSVRPRRREFAPSLSQLEPRALQTLIVGQWKINVHPGLLPPNNKFIQVHVYGQIASTKPASPTGFFFVTDEYRSDEPRGNFKIGRSVPDANFFLAPFDLTFYLQAKRSTNVNDGRHYDIFIGAKDADDTDGKTIAVYVPKEFAAPAHPATHAKPKP